eukprot:TRINITY_DN2758_c0_g1_i1.p1 TRINITY_DN2758_c0_g1~~TRINITY_DN2758_c0_g1_i1.p1  ORF type:complete len:421 (+),score=153.23 TRINITY_DN2758_c0_g1_i1:39-1265(+)
MSEGLTFKIPEKPEPAAAVAVVKPGAPNIKSPEAGPHAAPRGVRLQLPEGAQNAEAKPSPPRRGRVRGMSAVKKFQEEYVESNFLKELDDKAQAKAKTKSKAPMPNMVDLWSQVSQLKEEALVLKKSEAELKMENDDLRHEIKSLEWKMGEVHSEALKTLQSQEMMIRDRIEDTFSELRLVIMKLMAELEPEPTDAPVAAVTYLGHRPSTKKEMNEALLLEISRRHELEERLAEGEANRQQVDIVMETLQETQGELNKAKDTIAMLQNTVLEREQELGELATVHAERDMDVSKMETEVVLKDAELRKLRKELRELRLATEGIEEDKKKLVEAHKKLADAELKAIQAATQASVVAQAFHDSSPALSPRSNFSRSSAVDAIHFNTSPRGGYNNPYSTPRKSPLSSISSPR